MVAVTINSVIAGHVDERRACVHGLFMTRPAPIVTLLRLQVCWNAAVVPQQHRRLWGGVQLVKFTNMSDLNPNSSLALQSAAVRQLLMVSRGGGRRVWRVTFLQVPPDVVACTVKDALDGAAL